MHHSIALCEGPGHLSIGTRSDSGSWDFQPVDTLGLWPTWSPDGECIAASTLNAGTRDVRGSIELLDAEGRHLRVAHQSPAGAPTVIAPRVPHYVNWSPSGRALSFVAAGSDGLALYRSDRDGSYSSDRISSGAPIFHSWSPSSDAIAVHAGAGLSLYDVQSRETRQVAFNAVGFRTPVFAGDHLVYAMPKPPGVSVFSVSLEQGDEPRELAHFDGGVVLQPIGGERPMVGVAATLEADSGSFHRLYVLDPVDGGREDLAGGPFTAAMWSPSGEHVAVVIPMQTGDGRYAVQVYDRDGHYVAATEGFVPSQDFRTYLGFFDQYLLSHRLWAPDSSALLLAGRLPGDAIAWSFASQQNDYVWYWPVARGAPIERVGIGDIAVFRPRS